MSDRVDSTKDVARNLLTEWKGDSCALGSGCLDRVGELTARLGKRALVVANSSRWLGPHLEFIGRNLSGAGVKRVQRTNGSKPNSPREDVYRIQHAIALSEPDVIVAVGGGSTIDATKAANVLAILTPTTNDVEPFFGVGKVAQALEASGKTLPPLLAVQTAAGSGAHLTKYSNITDLATNQKLLIIDPVITPPAAVFDYSLTCSAPVDLTLDGAFDGMCHATEAYYSAGAETIDQLERIASAAVELVVAGIADAASDPEDLPAREALGLGADLGAYAIMIGSTNGPHLNSFSMVDVVAHGRACAILEPYYTVFFGPAIQRHLRVLGDVYARAGLIDTDLAALTGRDLGLAVAEGMLALCRKVGFPTTLDELPTFTDAHVGRALAAAKNPALASKLQGMPVPLSAEQVDEYMGAVLDAARTGDLARIRNMC